MTTMCIARVVASAHDTIATLRTSDVSSPSIRCTPHARRRRLRRRIARRLAASRRAMVGWWTRRVTAGARRASPRPGARGRSGERRRDHRSATRTSSQDLWQRVARRRGRPAAGRRPSRAGDRRFARRRGASSRTSRGCAQTYLLYGEYLRELAAAAPLPDDDKRRLAFIDAAVRRRDRADQFRRDQSRGARSARSRPRARASCRACANLVADVAARPHLDDRRDARSRSAATSRSRRAASCSATS